MPSYLLTPATAEPVSVIEMKEHLRVDTTADDFLIESYITAARIMAENITGRALMPQTRQLMLDDFDSTLIALPYPPLSTSTSDIAITYLNTTGGSTTLSSTVYAIDYKSEPGYISLAYGQDWPDVYSQRQSVTIQYKCGYPLSTNSSATTPEAIKQWIRVRVAQMYEYREPLITNPNLNELPRSFIDGLLDPYVVIEVV